MILKVIAIICAIVGIVGSIIPALPGPPISWVAILLLAFIPECAADTSLVVGYGIAAAVITVMDYVIPGRLTKKMGGTKGGTWGCNIGLIVSIIGLPFGPAGIAGVVFWPLCGAFVGEMLYRRPSGEKATKSEALRSAIGAFLGLLTGTLIKLAYCIVVLVVVLKAII